MAAIAPIGVQKTDCSVFQSDARGVLEVRRCVLVPANKRHPARRSGTDVKWNSRLRKHRDFFFEGVICFVPPVERDEIFFGQTIDPLGVLQNDIAPKEHRFASSSYLPIDLPQKIQIAAPFAEASTDSCALSLAEVPGFVAANVEIAAVEIWEQLVIEIAQKGHRLGMARRQRERPVNDLAPR